MTEPDDVTRRTHLAAERTWLAWWRTGIASVLAALAVGGLLPALVDRPRWPYVVLGCGYAATGGALFVAGAARQRAVDRALREHRYHSLPDAWLLAFSVAGAVLAAGTLVMLVLT